jgi:hypothetical protein
MYGILGFTYHPNKRAFISGKEVDYTSIRPLPTGQVSMASHRYDESWLIIGVR